MSRSDRDVSFTREAYLDVLVNVVPFAVLVGFLAMFFAFGPGPWDPLYATVHVAIVLVPVAVLAVLTYYALRAVTEAERAHEGEPTPGYVERDVETETGAGAPTAED